jgi:tryptophanyl-tRNA synthetase
VDIRAEGLGFAVWLKDQPVADGAPFDSEQARDAAIERLRAALEPQQD